MKKSSPQAGQPLLIQAPRFASFSGVALTNCLFFFLDNKTSKMYIFRALGLASKAASHSTVRLANNQCNIEYCIWMDNWITLLTHLQFKN
jgi:hypothetical protein